MKFGVALENFVPPGFTVDVNKIAEMAKKAEELGFESVWTWDHLLLGSKKVYPILDPVSVLSYVASKTSNIKLGTIYILPLRTPLVAAKQLSSLNYISKNRLMVTFVEGWYEREFKATGSNFNQRGKVLRDYLIMFKKLIKESDVNGKIEAQVYEHVNIQPKAPNLKIYIGAYLDAPIKRAAKLSDGWMAYYYKEEDFAKGVEIVKRYSLGRALENSDIVPYYIGDEGRQKVLSFTNEYMDLPNWSKCTVESGIYGNDKEIIERIKSYESAGAYRLVLIPAFYEMDQLEKLAKVLREENYL